MAASFASVDEYLAAQPEPARPILEQVRASIRKALPTAEECISYQMPAYRVGAKVAIYFAGWKKHYSLYPITTATAGDLATELAAYDVNEKGTVRFPYDAPVPVSLIGRVAKHLAAATNTP